MIGSKKYQLVVFMGTWKLHRSANSAPGARYETGAHQCRIAHGVFSG